MNVFGQVCRGDSCIPCPADIGQAVLRSFPDRNIHGEGDLWPFVLDELDDRVVESDAQVPTLPVKRAGVGGGKFAHKRPRVIRSQQLSNGFLQARRVDVGRAVKFDATDFESYPFDSEQNGLERPTLLAKHRVVDRALNSALLQ